MIHEGRDRFGHFYEDFVVGDIYRHWPGKTITESDNNMFCLLTLNHHPLHSDAEYAKCQRHGQPVVVGTLVLSVAVGMSVADISGSAIANLAYESIVHRSPVFIGDTLYAESEVLEKVACTSRTDQGKVSIETRAKNQRGDLVLTLRRTILVARRDAT